jgi:hypothetical protein
VAKVQEETANLLDISPLSRPLNFFNLSSSYIPLLHRQFRSFYVDSIISEHSIIISHRFQAPMGHPIKFHVDACQV